MSLKNIAVNLFNKAFSIFKLNHRKPFSYPEFEEVESILQNHYLISADYSDILKGDLNYVKRENSILICLLHIISNIRFALIILVKDKKSFLYTCLGDSLHVLGISGMAYYTACCCGTLIILTPRLVFFWMEYTNQLDFITDFTLTMPKNQFTIAHRILASNKLRLRRGFEKNFQRKLKVMVHTLKRSVDMIVMLSLVLFTSVTIYSTIICTNILDGVFYMMWLPVMLLFGYHAASDLIIPFGVWLIAIRYVQMRLDQFMDHVQKCVSCVTLHPRQLDYLIRDYRNITQRIFRYNIPSKWILLAYNYCSDLLVCILLYVAFVADVRITYVRLLFTLIAAQIFILGYFITMNASLVHLKAKSSYGLLNKLQVGATAGGISLKQKKRVSQ